jgi:UDP-GlcNAc:undecaprenyl-phosphate/decaprenyl-phosphate GlcNAc-1-phosphate transferase
VGLTYALTFVAALVLSFISTRVVRNTALRRKWGSRAGTARDVHTAAIPRLGGVAIFFSFSVTVGVALLLNHFRLVFFSVSARTVLQIAVPSTIIFLLGLYDDLVSTSPYFKFGVQALAAVPIYLAGFRVISVPLLFHQHTFGTAVSFLATCFWILLITNAFNLVDGLDGLAAGSALFSTVVVVVVSLTTQRTLVSLLGLALAGAICGFLRYNFNPATIFLGDSGSLFLGFSLSVLSMAGASKSSTLVSVAIPIVSFGLPIMETGFSIARRWLSGQPLFLADRHHIHHKLLERGFSQRQVVVILYGVCAVFALLSTLLLYQGIPAIGLVLLIVGAGVWIGVQHLNYPEFFEIGRVARRTLEQKKIIINNLAIRRATTDLAKTQTFADLRNVLDAAFQGHDFDAFDFRPAAPSGEPSRPMVWREDLCYRWKQNGLSPADANIWSLTLPLVAGNGAHCGEFVLYRSATRGALQVDINLIVQELQAALAECLNRIFSSEEKARQSESAQAALSSTD